MFETLAASVILGLHFLVNVDVSNFRVNAHASHSNYVLIVSHSRIV